MQTISLLLCHQVYRHRLYGTFWRLRGFHVLVGLDASAPRPRHLQGALSNMALRAHFDAFYRDSPSVTTHELHPYRNLPYGEGEDTRPHAGVPSEPLYSRGVSFSMGTSFDSIRMISPPDFIAMERRVWGWNPCSLRGVIAAYCAR